MLSKKTWFALAALLAVWAIWHSFQTVEVVYSRRGLDDGSVRVSKVVCGNGPAMVFAGSYDADVRGPATQADCLKSARTHVAELAGLVVLAAGVAWVGVRYGKRPPAPIDAELPRLPERDRAVEGRRRPSG